MAATKKEPAKKLTAEERRPAETKEQGVPWRHWGPYLSERQWGTVEIERRFLVPDPKAVFRTGRLIGWFDLRQGYLGHDEEYKIRVRITYGADGSRIGHLTRKTPRQGICREELELPLDLETAEQALALLQAARIIAKRRYLIRHTDGHEWAIDCFEGLNSGLVIAEIELSAPEESFELPDWVGDEITFDRRYGNSALARSPAPLETRLSGLTMDDRPVAGLRLKPAFADDSSSVTLR